MSLANHLFEHPWKSAKEKGTEAPSSGWESALTQVSHKSCSHRSSTMEVEKSEAPATPSFPIGSSFTSITVHYGRDLKSFFCEPCALVPLIGASSGSGCGEDHVGPAERNNLGEGTQRKVPRWQGLKQFPGHVQGGAHVSNFLLQRLKVLKQNWFDLFWGACCTKREAALMEQLAKNLPVRLIDCINDWSLGSVWFHFWFLIALRRFEHVEAIQISSEP